MSDFQYSVNQLERYLQKPADDFTREDIINYVFEKEIEMINFRYVADDEKLKTLNFVVTGRKELENLLKYGERVNGNAAFSFNTDQPDLYVIPNFNTAFVNPFTDFPTLDILCSFYTWEGEPLESSPENILKKAIVLFEEESGYTLKIFGELEYYVISEIDDGYQTNESNYQSSEPFSKYEKIRVEALQTLARCGGKIRFGHAENGSFNLNYQHYEQHEIEFLPCEPVDAIRQLHLAKWVLRMIGQKYNVDITFAPKVAMDKPGSGLHVHFILEKDGLNILGEGREYRQSALKMISGILRHAKALTAFGNTIPVSYLRLASSQKAPHYVCWGPSNRSALLRIPKINMKAINDRHQDTKQPTNGEQAFIYNQSIEYRGADASAFLHFFIASVLVAGIDGLKNDGYMNDVKSYLVSENLNADHTKNIKQKLQQLPGSCHAAATSLEKEIALFTESYPVFPSNIIHFIIEQLNTHNEKWCSFNPEDPNDRETINEMIRYFMHYR